MSFPSSGCAFSRASFKEMLSAEGWVGKLYSTSGERDRIKKEPLDATAKL